MSGTITWHHSSEDKKKEKLGLPAFWQTLSYWKRFVENGRILKKKL